MAWTEREVKKANRELSSLLSNMDGPLSRLEVVQKRYTELLSDMKRTEREHQKAKKRGDQLQKEKDAQRSELNKVTTMKDKLDKLSRDFAKENKKLSAEHKAAHEICLFLHTLCLPLSLHSLGAASPASILTTVTAALHLSDFLTARQFSLSLP